jgi:hypothetical protein
MSRNEALSEIAATAALRPVQMEKASDIAILVSVNLRSNVSPIANPNPLEC